MQAAHFGQRRTFEVVSKRFYAFNLREKTNKFVKSCAICALYKISRSQREDTGNHVTTEPLALLTLDCAGPYHGIFASSTGSGRYVLVAIDAFSRYAFGVVISSTSDDEIFRAMMEIRKQLCGLPSKVSCDNALLREHSRARRFLEENNVRILHGLPYVSRSQSKCERVIQTISRLFLKYHTQQPSLPMHKLVDEAVMAYNSTPHESLPNGLSPREVHFSRAPRSFLHAEPEVDAAAPPSIKAALSAARAVREEVLEHDVASYAKRQQKTSPTCYASRLKVGDLAIQKRTSYPAHTPRKLAFRVVIDAFEVTARVATNAFRVTSIITGDEQVLAGDLLIKIRGMEKDDLRALCQEMERVAARNSSRVTARVTRSMAARDAANNDDEPALGCFRLEHANLGTTRDPQHLDLDQLFV